MRFSPLPMTESVTETKLRKALTELEQAKSAGQFGVFLQHSFMHIINEVPTLQKEFEHRSHFYENLPSKPDFIALLDGIHARHKKFYRAIDANKLPEDVEFLEETGYSMKRYHALLASPWKWPPFNGHFPHDLHAPAAPWGEIIKKYKGLRPFAMEAGRLEVVDTKTWEELDQLLLQDEDDIKKLRDMLEGPFIRLKLWAFHYVASYQGRYEYISHDFVKTLLPAVRTVCEELIIHWHSQVDAERVARKRPKKVIRSVKNGIVTTMKGKEFSFKKKNSNSALLCEKVYSYCQRVGDAVDIQKVFPDIWKCSFNQDSVGNKKKVYFACRSANDWAKSRGLPKLLGYCKQEIERLA